MATGVGKIHCVKCGKDKATLRCGGCLQEFCYNHLGDHRQELDKQLDEIEVSRDVFRQTFTEQMDHPKTHILMQQIDEWEYNSIKKIKQIAAETREILLKNTNEYIHQIEIDLNKLTDQLRESRTEHDFNEINLHEFQEELERLTKNLTKSSKISIREDFTPFITHIYVDRSVLLNPDIPTVEAMPLMVPSIIRPDPQLVKLFKIDNNTSASVSNDEIISYIHRYMDPNEKYYIRKIVLSYLEACLIDSASIKKIQEDVAKQGMTVLNNIIDHKPELEIQAVYAIQNFLTKLEHPPKMAKLLFEIFYDEECITEDAFFEWLRHPDLSDMEGHLIVEISTKDFFEWLSQTENEVGEDEYED